MKRVSFSFTGAQSLLPPSAVCGGMKAPFLTSDACVSSLSIIVHGGSHAPPLVFRIARLCLPGADAFFFIADLKATAFRNRAYSVLFVACLVLANGPCRPGQHEPGQGRSFDTMAQHRHDL
jgi:hypothetical protein